MIAIARFIFVLINKERLIFSRYERNHPHCKWFLAADAILSTLLVVVGFGYASHADLYKRSGAVAMSATELTDAVLKEKSVTYWIGPIEGDKYTLIATSKDEIVVTYLPPDSNINLVDQPRLIFDTYANTAGMDEPIRPSRDTSLVRKVTDNGNIIEFDKDSMKEEMVTFIGRPEIVLVHYPSKQSLRTILANGQRLRQVS